MNIPQQEVIIHKTDRGVILNNLSAGFYSVEFNRGGNTFVKVYHKNELDFIDSEDK